MKKVIKDNPSKGLSFLYNTKLGRIILKPLVSSSLVSKMVGMFLNTKISCLIIKTFIKRNNINMDDYEEVKYKSFNDFFIRKVKKGKRNMVMDNLSFLSPCDSKLTIYKIDNDTKFNIKNSTYNVSSLIKDDVLAKKYSDGYVLVFRLSPEDYHRYYYIDDGKIINNYKIKGLFHTVNPIIYDKFSVFKENTRECTLIKTNNFGKIMYIEVGALMVGKIYNHKVTGNVKRNEEKGYFMFGGSTVCLLVEKNKIKINEEIIRNSKNGFETYVKCGEKIAEKIK